VVASSSLVVGCFLALNLHLNRRALGLVMAFGSGVLISAVSYELVGDAVQTADRGVSIAAGLLTGSAVFFVGDALIDRLGGEHRKDAGGKQVAGSALAIVLGIVLDGIPESVVIGLGLLEGSAPSVAIVVAVFLSNLPEAAAATAGLSRSGWRPGRLYALWAAVVLVSGLSSLAGYAFFGDASGDVLAFMMAFAGGAILTMLADTMMPEAFEQGGRLVGVFTTLGFALAFAISALE
jgi:ZIP family zinc transporter